MTTNPCRVCGQAATFSAVPLGSVHSLARCSACGVAQATRRPTAEELRRVYDDAYQSGLYDECVERASALETGDQLNQAYYRLFLAYAARRARGKTLVELGCGTGAFGHLAAARGWSYRGFDVNATALERARRLGLDVAEGAADDQLPIASGSVDVVAMWEVIEHLWSVDVCLRSVASWLKPRGVFMLSTPNFASDRYRRQVAAGAPRSSPPIHLTFFDKAGLKVAAAEAGLEPIVLFGYRLTRPDRLRDLPKALRRLVQADPPITMFGLFRRIR